ncbi:MAG: DUF115 domain-containing protein [Candidatus Methanoperedens sp.]|nr:DUF115 domain-containing protein [Candidatus Methanoperedens sp.]
MNYIKTSWKKEKKTDISIEVLNHIAARGSFVVIGSKRLYRDFNDDENISETEITPNQSLPEKINNKIREVNLKSWMENLADNMDVIKSNKDISHIPKQNGKDVIIVGGGPSFKEKGHIEILKHLKGKTIISTDKMLIPLLKSGITPDFVLSVDGHRQLIETFYESELFDAKLSTIGIMAIMVAPKVVQRFKGEKIFFTPMIDDVDQPVSLSMALSHITKKSILSTGGNTGITCINLAYYLGFKNIILTGMDLGYTMETPIEKSAYYPVVKEVDPTITPERYKETYVIEGYNPDFKINYYTDVTWKSHIDNLVQQSIQMSKDGVNIINATEGGALHGGAIKSMKLEEAIHYE